MFQLEGSLAEELDVMIQDALPRETGGVIIDGREAVELNNYAELDSAFEFHLVELREVINAYGMKHADGAEISERVVLWHSHPSGTVGPSREDMRNKTPLKYHLVIAFVDGNLVPTWY
ncbi:MAG: Mov34/MPN/PAD-1 family protein [Aurantimicrobium sp.]|uniref:Mov34/MPN/PAD-1 family protein n=1 Tax=Aurantimicrobium sp. TaxID=1930784 RepID=UPI002FC9AFB6